MCEKAMQCHLREYHSFSEEETISWAEDDDNDHALARAWFPDGMDWYETSVSPDTLAPVIIAAQNLTRLPLNLADVAHDLRPH
jgi:hypothetical protein